MSTTTEHISQSGMRSALRLPAAGLGVLALWFAGLAGLTAGIEPEDTVLAFGPEHRLFHALAADNALLVSNGPGFIRVRGQSAGFVARLYANGAWLVLPGTAFGCGPGVSRTSTAIWKP
jgi:hypothetical protein